MEDTNFGTPSLCYRLNKAPLEAFCLYGLVSAAACTVRLCAFVVHSEGAFVGEEGQEVDEFCQHTFSLFHDVLAGYANYMEFLWDSGWPWTLRSLWHAVAEWRGEPWQEEAVIEETVRLELSMQKASLRELALHSSGGLPHMERMQVFALGMHTGLLRAPLDALRLALDDGLPRLEIIAPAGGGGVLCKVAPGDACGPRDEAFAEIYQEYVSHWYPDLREPLFNRQGISSLSEMGRSFRRVYDEAMRAADLLICSEPLAFCSFLEDAGRPVLMYTGNNPLFYLRQHDFEAGIESLRRLAAGPRNTLLGLSSGLVALLNHHLGGTRAAVVDTPLSLHIGTALYGYSVGGGDGLGALLVTKRVTSTFDHECMIVTLLRAAAEGADAPLPQFVHLDDPTTPEWARTYDAWTLFRAALVLPMDSLQMVIYDMYAMGLPMFVPDPIQRLPSFIFRKARALARSEPTPFRGKGQRPPPGQFPHRLPFTDPGDLADLGPGQGWDALRAWSRLSDFARLPHLCYFLSLAELVEALQNFPALEETSRLMKVEHSRLMAVAAGLWRGVLVKAFSGGEAGVQRSSYRCEHCLH